MDNIKAVNNMQERRQEFRKKVERKSIGQIATEIRDGYDSIEKTSDLATTYKLIRQMSVLQEIIDDYVSFAVEMELDLDDPLFS